jgi:hypothetical protein
VKKVDCAAPWCTAPALEPGALCQRHDDLLTVELRAAMLAGIQGAVAYITQLQMRAAFDALPEASKRAAREAAKKL